MDFSSGTAEIILDKTTRPTVSGLMTPVPVPVQAANEFTVASFNMERFYNDIVDADNPGSSVVKVTTEAYQRRLTKASLAIRNILNFPDILGVQEIENINVLTDLANKISSDANAAGQTDPVYLPYLFLATDGTGINTGHVGEEHAGDDGEGRAVRPDDDLYELDRRTVCAERPYASGAACRHQARSGRAGLSGDGDLGASAFADQCGRSDQHGRDGASEA